MSRRSSRRPSPLKRRRHVAEPQRRYFVYCEGTETERAYFRSVRQRYGNVQVEPIGVGGVPRTVAQRAIDRARDLRLHRGRHQGRTSSFEEADQVAAVFDQNGHPDVNEVIAMCRANRVAVARSNPCFELWLVLHIEDYDKPATPGDVQRRLHVLYPAYHHEHAPSPGFENLVAELVRLASTRGDREQFAALVQNATQL